MASFTFQEIFGSSALREDLQAEPPKLIIDLNNFYSVDYGGDLPQTVAISDSSNISATQLFYACLLLLQQNQGEKIDTDPAQKVYVTDAGKSIATGARDGQVKRSFTVSFFIDAELAGTPSIDQIDPYVAA